VIPLAFDERRLAASIVASVRPYPAKADLMVARVRGLLGDKASLEAPFGPFVGEERKRLERAAEKSGKPDLFIAYIKAKCEIHPYFTEPVLGDAVRTNEFLNSLESSVSNRSVCRDAKGNVVNAPLSDASIVAKIELAFGAAWGTRAISANEGRTRALRELDPFEMGDGVSGHGIRLKE